MLKLINSNINNGEVSSSDTLENLWARYSCARYQSADADFLMTGEEYGTVCERRRFDARAAAIYFDVNTAVRAAQLVDVAAPAPTCGERHVGELILAAVTHEVACMKYLGEIPGYGETTLSSYDEPWDTFMFAHKSDAAALPQYVAAFRREMIAIPDYSNIVELPLDEPLLAKAN